MSKYSAIRKEIQSLAEESRTSKSRFKKAQQAFSNQDLDMNRSKYIDDIAKARSLREVNRDYNRYFHLAYGIIRGRTLKQMESKVAPGNDLNLLEVERMIKYIQEKYLVENQV